MTDYDNKTEHVVTVTTVVRGKLTRWGCHIPFEFEWAESKKMTDCEIENLVKAYAAIENKPSAFDRFRTILSAKGVRK